MKHTSASNGGALRSPETSGGNGFPNAEGEHLMERAMLKGSLIFSTGHSQSEVTTQGECQGNNYPKYLDLIFPTSSTAPSGPPVGWTPPEIRGQGTQNKYQGEGWRIYLQGQTYDIWHTASNWGAIKTSRNIK